MPDITAAGTFTGNDIGFEFLKSNKISRGLLFSGSTLPTTLEVGMLNDVGVFVAFTNGTITALPTSLIVDSVPEGGVVIEVTGGSPDFNLSHAGPEK